MTEHEPEPRRIKITAVLTGFGLAALALIGGILYGRGHPVMPLDDKTLEQFQEANSRAARKLLDLNKELPSAAMSSAIFRTAVTELGYDPDQSLLYWMSPQFKQDLTDGNPNEVVMKSRLTESLVGMALGDGASDEDFVRILKRYSSKVRDAAQARRAGAGAAPP